MTATVINFGSLKGGVGKTKTATNVAAVLAMNGHRTLLVDLDPQANATADCGVAPELGFSIGELLNTPAPYTPPALEAILQPTELEGLTVAPSIYRPLEDAELVMSGPKAAMAVRKLIVDPVRDEYDFIIIDTPPKLAALTFSAVQASDYAVPVVGPEAGPMHGAYAFQTFVEDINSYSNTPITIPCWLAANWEDSAKGREVLEVLNEDEDVRLLSTRLPRSRRAGAAPTDYEMPIVAAQPGYPFSVAVRALAAELLEVIGR